MPGSASGIRHNSERAHREAKLAGQDPRPGERERDAGQRADGRADDPEAGAHPKRARGPRRREEGRGGSRLVRGHHRPRGHGGGDDRWAHGRHHRLEPREQHHRGRRGHPPARAARRGGSGQRLDGDRAERDGDQPGGSRARQAGRAAERADHGGGRTDHRRGDAGHNGRGAAERPDRCRGRPHHRGGAAPDRWRQ